MSEFTIYNQDGDLQVIADPKRSPKEGDEEKKNANFEDSQEEFEEEKKEAERRRKRRIKIE